MLTLLIIFNILNLYDYISTKILLTFEEIYEANPISRWLLDKKLYLLCKIAIQIIISVVFYLLKDIKSMVWLLGFANVVLGYVCVNNTKNYIKVKR